MITKIDEFGVVLEIKFLLELKVIPIPLAKCLMITGSTSTIVHTKVKQPNETKTILASQLKKSLTHELVRAIE